MNPAGDSAPLPAGATGSTNEVTMRALVDIAGERRRQLYLWGRHSYPDGTGDPAWAREATEQGTYIEQAGATGDLTWLALVRQDISALFAEPDPTALRADLVRAAALLCAWVEDLDRQRNEAARADAETDHHGNHHAPSSQEQR